ncbi:hypothetical protein HF086_014171 [Spodoptera exigua]|uniref:Uncharacterized protein n=1 Tax=Spodoptera exigua TaxID=7107 RepID=A0A922N1A8_SPOEX|nr:hypothetical protein HF086_014171 [Spodoptera exigua]
MNQFRTNSRNTQVEGQVPNLEDLPAIETSTKVPVVPNQRNNYGAHVMPSSNDFLLTNLGLSKTVIPRTAKNGFRTTQLEVQITTEASGLVKDTLKKVPSVPKTPVNPYRHLMDNNNGYINPDMANIGLGIGSSKQAVNGAQNTGLEGPITNQGSSLVKDPLAPVPSIPKILNNPNKPILANNNASKNPSMGNIGLESRLASNGAGMPSHKFNGAGMPKMAQEGFGTGTVGTNGELPMM